MNFPSGFGGITLILIAVVWLLVFVPGWTKRSEHKQVTSSISRVVRAEKSTRNPSSEDRIGRLFVTMRSFSLLAAILMVGAVSSWLLLPASLLNTGLAGLLVIFAVASFIIRLAAKRQLRSLVVQLNAKRQVDRERVIKEVTNQTNMIREWTPNPIPAPLNLDRAGELLTPDAEVIELKTAAKKEFDTQDLNAILRRRRAI